MVCPVVLMRGSARARAGSRAFASWFLQAAIDRFSAPDSNTFAFLLSTKAGGLGITLTAVSPPPPLAQPYPSTLCTDKLRTGP